MKQNRIFKNFFRAPPWPSTSPRALIGLKYSSTTTRLMSCCTEVAGEKQVRPVHGHDKKTLMETVCDLVETVRSS